MIQDILRDFVLFNGAEKMVGRIETFTPPNLERQVEAVRMSGMDAPMPVDMGMMIMEASFLTTGIDMQTYAGFGLMNGLRTTVKVRGIVLDPVSGVGKPVEHTLTGDITKIEPVAWKVGERAGLNTSMQLIFYELKHGGTPVIKIDVVNAIRMINGVDHLIQHRAMTGR